MKKEPTQECPITKVAQVLSDTWTMLIMHHLIKKPLGFCDLERALDGISTRTLTLKLTKLMEEKMVAKDKRGLYTATARGKGLKAVEKAMMRYQKVYL
ncbi:MAG: helix-turn-helix transcriptional regulator [Parcubacteria group bacterium]|nr:helix-turn-helix transcriptional regulator [Parcubacteria group bacterium]